MQPSSYNSGSYRVSASALKNKIYLEIFVSTENVAHEYIPLYEESEKVIFHQHKIRSIFRNSIKKSSDNSSLFTSCHCLHQLCDFNAELFYVRSALSPNALLNFTNATHAAERDKRIVKKKSE